MLLHASSHTDSLLLAFAFLTLAHFLIRYSLLLSNFQALNLHSACIFLGILPKFSNFHTIIVLECCRVEVGVFLNFSEFFRNSGIFVGFSGDAIYFNEN